MAALDRDGPVPAVRAHALDPQSVEPARELVVHGRDEPLALAVWLDPEEDPNEEDRSACGPRLWPRRGRIGDRERRVLTRVAGEHLGERPVEVPRRFDERAPDAACLLC